MMVIQISDSGPELTDASLEAFESATGRRIPESYRQFLLAHNGGWPLLSSFEIGEDREPVSIKTFLGIGLSEPTFNIDYVLETFHGSIPPGFFPIARDPGGNLLGILEGGAQDGAVRFWDHETGSAEISSLTSVADSFEDFLASLTE